MEKNESFDLLTVCLAPTLQHTLVFESCVAGIVNRARESYLDASGKGVNAARIAAQSGATALHITHVGGSHSALFESLCARDGVLLEAVRCSAEIRFCTTVVNLGSGAATELVEECPPVPPTTWRFLKERFCALLDGSRAVLISGKPASGYPAGALPELARLAKHAGKPLVLDLRGKDLVESLPFKPDLCKPNAQELRDSYSILGFSPKTSVAEAAAELSKNTGCAFLVTDGPRPAIFASGGKSETLSVETVKAVNPIGSGDACAAGAALALARGATLREACRSGLALGSSNAGTIRPGRLPGF
jgi:fructose-1-phosphate kinase PfkB-like protein